MAMMLAIALLVSPCALAGGALSRTLARQMELNRERYGIPGQALLVAHNGRVLFRGVDGEADLRTHERLTTDFVFPGYSLSKLFVSALVMQLVESGQVALDAPASTYLPDLPARWKAISVRDFLDHTSGVPDYFDTHQGKETAGNTQFPPDLQAVFGSLADVPLLFLPGTKSRYTQTNYVVLAALLAKHYGKPYAQVAQERIIDRLHLQHTWLGMATPPKQRVVSSYIGREGHLEEETDLPWPAYAYGHATLHISLDDLARFLQAMTSGELVSKSTLQRLWQPRMLADGQRGWFAIGWEYGESGAYRQVGHDGGTRVRVRILFDGTLDGDVYIFIYLTNGSAKNVWSRMLVDSAMAVVAPDRFPVEALSEALVGYALRPPAEGDTLAQAKRIRAGTTLSDMELERTINTAGYTIRENLGVDPALRVFVLNTVLFPDSANAWDSLAEAHAAKGDTQGAKLLYEKSRRLSSRQR
ncbi:serine hydrolase domain-containing protein [Pseudoxanthomonas sp. JBR18]|uniref:serine hydrolase domain-containing protein n=1 Tax=Pseudoxanthomonas sp. JBR18 TaxID=2969308 RepID=UPI002306BCD1|nr:serine hydrolase domain-containing protein [Pseudoxanthomonas sp. JBR18]WCE05968.1 serine hydrolase [Pseudoxanthomonas sp. JBR18]